ncbi:hypothetical protein GLOIN_2v1679048, partial [Rhizophagus irregularis DAOM 181602=DAOM 197198]
MSFNFLITYDFVVIVKTNFTLHTLKKPISIQSLRTRRYLQKNKFRRRRAKLKLIYTFFFIL